MQEAICHVLVVDAQSPSWEVINGFFWGSEFQVRTVTSWSEARAVLVSEVVDVVLLDVSQCRAQGFSRIGDLRDLSGAGIILVGDQAEHADCICGLEAGADDCLCKPIDSRELCIRICNLAVKTRALRLARISAPVRNVLQFAGWELDLDRRQLLSPQGATLHLTGGEFGLLAALAANPGSVLSRDWLLERISAKDLPSNSRSVDVAVAQLRRKLGDDPRQPVLIATVHGVGYRFSPS